MNKPGYSLNDLKTRTGSEIGVSNWHVVDQDRVTRFAEVTEDLQYIHVDPERAAGTPFGGTIAHGFLSLSLLSVLFTEAVGEISGISMAVNYGFDSIRFIAPVRTGKRLRGRFVLLECSERKPGQWRLTLQSTVEIEGEEKPALVANWLAMMVAD